MPTDSTPPLLDPYIRIPSTDTLILSTYVLGALNNWVLIRYLHACLRDSNSKSNSNSNSNSNNRNGFHNSDVTNVPREQEKEKQAGDDVAVVLVSWMRDFAFWKTEAKRAVGLDLARLQQAGRFAFVDGLSRLYDGTDSNISAQPQTQTQPKNHTNLTDPSLHTLTSTLTTAISSLDASATRIILILDTPTLPLSLDPTITAQNFAATLLTLRAHPRVSGCIVSCPVDDPFVAPALHAAQSARGPSGSHGSANGAGAGMMPLEITHSAVIAQLAQQAVFVIGTRRLGTGWARDVSGVLRVTRGGGFDEAETDEVQEGEWLYLVEGDGSARVWVRGSGVG